jgi:hypothetical protein
MAIYILDFMIINLTEKEEKSLDKIHFEERE